MLCVLYFFYTRDRPANAAKIANLAQHPKSLGTAALYYYASSVSFGISLCPAEHTCGCGIP